MSAVRQWPSASAPRRRHEGAFGGFVAAARRRSELVVQPRMGMSDPNEMRAGLLATRHATGTTIGTITLDSYTRVGDHASASLALLDGVKLNGYPLIAHGLTTTREVLAGVAEAGFPVQVRHGSPYAQPIIAHLIAAGLDATEGGPVSYCLPYGRLPLHQSIRNWAEACQLLASLRDTGADPHLETFGGCMLGQLCPPGLLVAISVLEALFFRQYGIASVSVSYAQQTNADQDREAIGALRRICGELLHDVDWHVVVYGYMGVYPRTPGGAVLLGEAAARLAVRTGAERLIVKTVAESQRIPTVSENVAALEHAARIAVDEAQRPVASSVADSGIEAEARALIGAVLELDEDVGQALRLSFARGYLDVPYCLHPDNARQTRAVLGTDGRLRWSRIGSMPIGGLTEHAATQSRSSSDLLTSLSYVQRTFDKASAVQQTCPSPRIEAQ